MYSHPAIVEVRRKSYWIWEVYWRFSPHDEGNAEMPMWENGLFTEEPSCAVCHSCAVSCNLDFVTHDAAANSNGKDDLEKGKETWPTFSFL